jgi:hypothetical protein
VTTITIATIAKFRAGFTRSRERERALRSSTLRNRDDVVRAELVLQAFLANRIVELAQL